MLPKCGIYARLSFPVDDEPPKKITLRLVDADGVEKSLGALDAAIINKSRDDSQAKGSVKAGLISTALIAPFPITKEGRMNVIVNIDDEESVCGTLNVQITGA